NVQVAKLKNTRIIVTDMDAARLAKARKYGADEVYRPGDLPHIKADKVILCTGALPAVEQAFRSLDRKGTLLLFAIPETDIRLPTVDVWRNEMSVTSSYGAAPKDLQEAIDLIKKGKVDMKDLITHKLPLDQAQEGFRLVAEAKQSLKVILIP
ncbi:MAG TPA: zinc-binding dehydrogenase, partial [Candidatus Omnitrophota bacterium]|nr:zinc-binding dehydrogenase [Candidatus Omnitrophota bacterium]